MSESIARKVIRTHKVKDWLANLQDELGKGAITERIERMKTGNFGKIDNIKSEPGLWEMIIDDGPGYRVYFAEFDGNVIVLVLGGPKSTQKADIKTAGAAMRWLKEKHAENKAKAEKDAVDKAKAEKAPNKGNSTKTKSKGK